MAESAESGVGIATTDAPVPAPPANDATPTEPTGVVNAAPEASEDAGPWGALPAEPGPANPSPDGTLLAYLRLDAEGALSLRLLPTDGGPERPVSLPFVPLADGEQDGLQTGDEGPQWSPDGDRLAVIGPHPSATTVEAGVTAVEAGVTAIWLVEVASGDAVPLVAHPASDRGPRWSPDGTTIAFTSRRDGRDTVCGAPADGLGPAVALTDGTTDDRDPAWSRDGAMLVFRRRSAEDPRHDDLWIATLATGELRPLTGRPGKVGLGSKPASRRSPCWAPDRSQIAYVTDEKDWDILAVVNADNGSGWTLAGEPGDKAAPRWDPTGKKLLYTRALGPAVACCAKGTSAASAETVDPGEGVARSPRWLPDGRVVYLFADPRHPAAFLVQDAKAGVPRAALPAPEPVAADRDGEGAAAEVDRDGISQAPTASPATASPATASPAAEGATAADGAGSDTPPTVDDALGAPLPGLVLPIRHEVETGDGLKLGGLLYRPAEAGSVAPGVVSLGDGPPARHEANVRAAEQRLAASDLVVFAPNLRGTKGGGRPVLDGLLETADAEVEAADLDDIAANLADVEGVDGEHLAVVGRGFGGTLALLAAGARPGTYRAVAAIDPIADWDQEFDAVGGAARRWFIRQYGLPAGQRVRYGLRTPATFAALIEGPVLLVGTGDAPAGRAPQLDALAAAMAELGVAVEREDAPAGEPEGVTYGRVAAFLRRAFADG